MPLTLSHPAVVLPLRRLGLPATVLVIASMVPDLPLFLGSVRGYDLTHSAVGLVTVNLVLAICAVAWWTFVMRDALVDAAPEAVRRRLAPEARLSRREWTLAPIAACIGAATHIVWDSFTHQGEWGTDRIAWLRAEHAGLSGANWMQYISGVVGLAIVALAALAYLHGTAARDETRPSRVLPPATLPVVIVLAGLVGAASATSHFSSGFNSMAFNGVVAGLISLAIGLTIMTGAWHIGRGIPETAP